MKTHIQYLAVIMSAFLMLTGAAMAQNSTNSTEDEFSSNNTSENISQLGDGVRSYNFNIQGLPAQAALEGPANSAERTEDRDAERTEESVVRLSGFIVFNTGGYEVDVESETEERTVDLTVTIEDSEGPSTQVISRVPVEENVEADAGNYTVNLDVVRGNETVLQRTEEVTVPESREDSDDDSERFEQNPENMTRDELIEEVRDLRERIRELTASESDEDSSERQGPPEEVPANPGQEDEDSNESESENESRQGPPSETPGQGSDNRPGFVNNLLRGIFG